MGKHRKKPDREGGLDSGAYCTPVPAGCAEEGRGCLRHGMDVTAPDP